MLLYHIIFKFKDLIFSRAKKGTLPRGNAARSKITDFRTALYPRQYHPCDLEKPLVKRLFAYKVFFRRTCRRKNKIRLTAAKKLNLRFFDRLRLSNKTACFLYFGLIRGAPTGLLVSYSVTASLVKAHGKINTHGDIYAQHYYASLKLHIASG